MSLPILTIVDEVEPDTVTRNTSDPILVQPRKVSGNLIIRQNTGKSVPSSPAVIHNVKVLNLKEEPKKTSSLDPNMVECPFKLHGCHKIGEKNEVKRHVRDDRNLHLVLLCQALNPIRSNALRQQNIHMDNYVSTITTIERAEAVFEKFGCQYTFHVPNIAEAVLRASKNKKHRTIFSQPFYTHGYGYKMMAIAAPYGDGNALREYFSIFVCLMNGEYDAVQEWPFRRHVTFSLVSKDGLKETAFKTYCPGDHPESADFMERPKGLRNGAFGFQDFIELGKVGDFTFSDDFFVRIRVHLKEEHVKEIDSSKCQGELIDYSEEETREEQN